jgi:hypothetical protein
MVGGASRTAEAMDHDWVFLGIAAGEERCVIVVCRACGEARYHVVRPEGGQDHRVDLSGDCPGRPRRPSKYESRPA